MIMVKSVPTTILKEMELKSLSDLLPLKKTTTQIILSISIFSLVFSCCSSILLHYQNLHHFSYNPFHLSSFAANKNCIFLICNGILVFVANSSAAVRPPSASDVSDMLQKKIEDSLLLETSTQTEAEEKEEEGAEEEEVVLSDKHIVLDDTSQSTEEGDVEEGEENVLEEMRREIEHCSSDAQVEKEDADRNESRDSRLFDDSDYRGNRDEEEAEEEEVDEIEKLSTEELNQRFEDFIRRMKEEFRVNDYERQQLVMVK